MLFGRAQSLFLFSVAVLSSAQDCLENGCICTTANGKTDINCRSLHLKTMPNLTNVPISTVRTIDLSMNIIRSVPLLQEVDGLKTLLLGHNEITSIAPEAFKYFNYLEVLDLCHNQVSDLTGLAGLTGLTHLNLSENIIRGVPNNIFTEMKGLVELNLRGNPLHYVRYDMFQELPRLFTLDLSHCALSSLPPDVFHGMISLEELDLSGNLFEYVPSTGLTSPQKLKRLKFNENQVTMIRPNSFKKCKHLEYLELSDMGTLETIKPGAFSGLKMLQVLKITNNPSLKNLDYGAFEGLYHTMDDKWILQELIIRDNGLTEIQSPSTTLCKITTLDLQGNPWNCDCHLHWTTICNLRDELTANLKCSSPPRLDDQLIRQLQREDMVCLPKKEDRFRLYDRMENLTNYKNCER